MAKTPKNLLIFSLILFTVSIADTHGTILWGTAKPVGVILFVLFMITQMTAGEMAKYDEECQSKLKTHRKRNPAKKVA